MSPLPPKMHVTADCATVRHVPGSGLEVLLIRRANPPYQGQWALPGGFVELDEDLPDAALRELREETGVVPRALEPVGLWGRPGRDPRGRVVTAAFVAVVGPGCEAVRGADDAAEAAWHPRRRLPSLAFDHADIIAAALTRLKELCERTHLSFALLDERFTLCELEELLVAVGSEAGPVRADSVVARARLVRKLEPAAGSRYLYCGTEGDFLEPLARDSGQC